jgi:hypothetical protein
MEEKLAKIEYAAQRRTVPPLIGTDSFFLLSSLRLAELLQDERGHKREPPDSLLRISLQAAPKAPPSVVLSNRRRIFSLDHSIEVQFVYE